MIYSIIHVFSWKLVYLTTVESYSHFCTLINLIIIICSIQYIQTNGRLRRLKNRAKGKQRLWEILTAAIVLSFWKLPLNSFCQHLFDEKRKGIYIFNLYFQIKTLLKTAVYIFIFIYTKYKKPLFLYRIVICQSLGSPNPTP